VNLGQDAEQLCLDSRQRSCSRQQLAAAGMIYATFSAGSIKNGAKPGTRLVSDSMKCQQRFAHTPIATLGEVLERYFSALTKSLPFLSQEVRERSLSILDPQVPPPTGLFDRVGPAGNATRRPIHAAGWRQDKSVHLCTAEDYFCEGEHIGGPIEEFVGNGGSREGVPDGGRRRLHPAETQLQHFLFLVGHSRFL
jgi:hypothetical protein